jgi:hypothetical protein
VAAEQLLTSISGPGFPAGRRDNRLKEQGKKSRIWPVNFSTTGQLEFGYFLALSANLDY